MKKIILSLLVVVGLSACASGEVKIAPGTVIVTGQVVNRDSLSPNTVRAHFQNPFDGDGSSPAAPLDADGSFRIEYEMPYGQTVNIRYGRPFYTFFAAPGDSIHITIDAAKLGKEGELAVVFSGDRGEQNNRFMAAYDQLQGHRGWFDEALEPTDFLEAVKNRIQLGRDSLAAYAGREKLPAEVVQWIDNEIVCAVLYYAAMYREEEPLSELMNRLFTEVVDIFDPRYASSAMYGVDLGWYIQRGIADMSLMEDPEALLRDFLQKVRDKPAGLARDIMLYDAFYQFEQMFPGVINGFAEEVPPLLDAEHARQLFARLTGKEQKAFEFRPTPLSGISRITADMQTEALPQVDMFQYLAERHPGKAVYIDVSASWCGPCIEQFPHAKTLEGSLAGEDVVFVILWLESNFDAATALIREYELPGEHYFFSSDAARLFLSACGIPGFPTYLLMDKTGKPVNMNAPRPSDPRAEEQIRELLK